MYISTHNAACANDHMCFSRDEARQPLLQKPEAIVAGGMQSISMYKSDPVALAFEHVCATGNDIVHKAVLDNAMCVTSCPVITDVTIGGNATTPMASPCTLDVTSGKVTSAHLTAVTVRPRKCVSFANAIKGKTVDRIRYDDNSTPQRLSSFPLWTMPLAGEPKGRLLDKDGNERR